MDRSNKAAAFKWTVLTILINQLSCVKTAKPTSPSTINNYSFIDKASPK